MRPSPSPIKLAVTLLALSPIAAWHCHAQISPEDYENHAVGTYEGAWDYAYTDPSVVTNGGLSSQTDSVLSIRNGASEELAASPAGGNYLFHQSVDGRWGGDIYTGSDPVTGESQSAWITSDPWESTSGHLIRTEMLEGGVTYQVDLYRAIGFNEGASFSSAFSVWDGTPDPYQPFNLTPDNLLTHQPYDSTSEEWQQVSLQFTPEGTGQVPVTFMMGLYEPHDDYLLALPTLASTPDWDGDFRTIDDPSALPEGWFNGGQSGTAFQYQWVALDGFSVTPVPEPSGVLLLCSTIILGILHRQRRA